MTGQELRQLARAARLKPTEVCSEADISSPTLYKVYNDQKVEPGTKEAVERAIHALRQKVKQALATG